MTDIATRTTPTSAKHPPELFMRKSSGLVRDLGPFQIFVIATAIMEIAAIYPTLTPGMAAIKGGDFTLPLIVGFVLAAPVGLMFAQLTQLYPRAGGDYVYASRVVHPLLGAALGGALMVVTFLTIGINALFLGQASYPLVLQAIGLNHLASSISTPTGAFLTSAGTLVILGLVATRRLLTVTRVIFWAFAISLLGFGVDLIVLATHSHAQFAHAFAGFTGRHNAYSTVISTADKEGLQSSTTFGTFLSLFAFAFVVPQGYWYAAMAGGEIKRPARSFSVGALSALAVCGVLAIGAWLIVKNAIGLHFLQAAPWLSQHDPNAYAHISSDNPLNGGVAYGVMLSGSKVIRFVIASAIPATTVALDLALIAVVTRVVFALSFDRLLPARMSSVSRRSHVPIFALALTVVVSVAFVAVGSYSSSFVTLFRNDVLMVFAIAFVTSLVAIVLPFRRRKLYEASPKVAGDRWFGVPSLTILGIVSAIGLGGGALLAGTQPAINGGYSAASVITLLAIAGLGLLLYLIAWLRTRRRGIDIGLAMRELPPE